MFDKLKSWIRSYFGFSRTEANGFLILAILFPVVLFLPAFLKVIIDQNTNPINVNTRHMDSLVTLMEKKIASAKITKVAIEHDKKVELTRFNPNVLNYQELLGLGLSASVARRVINYRKKGGKFVVKRDFNKIYGLTTKQFDLLKPYIDLPDNITSANKKQGRTRVKEDYPRSNINDTFDLNQTDTLQLKSINGIGSKLSSRIIKFRNRLGGFVSIDQLGEVYGLSEEVLEKIKRRGFVSDEFHPKLININEADASTIGGHPYIPQKIADQIVKYRNQHGAFENLRQLMNIHIIDENDYKKINPYLGL